MDGNYLSRAGTILPDRINSVYSDAPIAFQHHADRSDGYAKALRGAAFKALNEEVVLVAVHPVFHSE